MILWQQVVIKYLVTESAYEEAIKVGEKKGIEWVKRLLVRTSILHYYWASDKFIEMIDNQYSVENP